MTNKWFECKVAYRKVAENGLEYIAKESYLIDALSYSEAESRFIEIMRPFMSGEFEVSSIKRVIYSEVFFNDNESADKWYRFKLQFISIDEKSGAEKKSNLYALTQAADLREAIKYLDEQMKGTVEDYEIVAVSETPIMDVYPYEAN